MTNNELTIEIKIKNYNLVEMILMKLTKYYSVSLNFNHT